MGEDALRWPSRIRVTARRLIDEGHGPLLLLILVLTVVAVGVLLPALRWARAPSVLPLEQVRVILQACRMYVDENGFYPHSDAGSDQALGDLFEDYFVAEAGLMKRSCLCSPDAGPAPDIPLVRIDYEYVNLPGIRSFPDDTIILIEKGFFRHERDLHVGLASGSVALVQGVCESPSTLLGTRLETRAADVEIVQTWPPP